MRHITGYTARKTLQKVKDSGLVLKMMQYCNNILKLLHICLEELEPLRCSSRLYMCSSIVGNAFTGCAQGFLPKVHFVEYIN